MASWLDNLNWTNNPYLPVTTPAYGGAWDVDEFYRSVGSPILKLPTAKPRGTRPVTLPTGETIAPSGSESVDFLNGIFGKSPLSGDSAVVDPETGEPTGEMTGAGADWMTWIGDSFSRVAVIVLGFVFVAVGLSMFRQGA